MDFGKKFISIFDLKKDKKNLLALGRFLARGSQGLEFTHDFLANFAWPISVDAFKIPEVFKCTPDAPTPFLDV